MKIRSDDRKGGAYAYLVEDSPIGSSMGAAQTAAKEVVVVI